MVDESLHGKLYEADCYIILKTFWDANGGLTYSIYFWIGEKSPVIYAENFRKYFLKFRRIFVKILEKFWRSFKKICGKILKKNCIKISKLAIFSAFLSIYFACSLIKKPVPPCTLWICEIFWVPSVALYEKNRATSQKNFWTYSIPI